MRFNNYSILLASFFLLFACSPKTNKENSEGQLINPAFLENVKTVKATRTNLKEDLVLTGKVDYDPDRVINYVPLLSGVVDKTYFLLGDKVTKGEVMMDIRSQELSGLKSELIALEDEEQIAERELKSAESMNEDKIMSDIDLLGAKGKLRQAQAELAKVKMNMDVLGHIKGDGSFSINAPMTGYVVSKKVSSGTTISAESEPVFTIADLSTVWIMVNVYASNLMFVREGMDVEITTLSYPGEIFYGKINSMSQVFDPEEKVLKARIVMPNKDLKLKPEMSTVIKLKNETSNAFVSVPSDAIIFDNNSYFVVTEDSPSNFAIKPVSLQGHNNKTTYIATGLSEGENVVVKNQLLIYSGLKGE